MNTVDGLVIGNNATGGLKLDLALNCAKDNDTAKEHAVTLHTGVHLNAKFSFDNFEYFLELSDVTVQNTTTTSDIGEMDYHNWDSELYYVIKDIVDDSNLRLATPIDLKKTGPPIISFVAGLFKNTIMSPTVSDEFIALGFSMLAF